MATEIRDFGYLFLNTATIVLIVGIVLCASWIIISHYWVWRRAGWYSVLKWHKNTIHKYGFNDAIHSLKILGLSTVSLVFLIPTASDFLTGLCAVVGACISLFIAALIAERRQHWGILKSSAIEVVLESNQ